MDIIEEKIKELLAEAKTLLKNKQVSETVEKIKQVLQLDPENEEAKYVLDKLNIATGVQIEPQRKLLIISSEQETISCIKVLFNGIEIGQLKNGFFEFPLKNDGIVELKQEYLNINISVHKNQSSVVIVKIGKEKDQLLYDQFDFDNIESLLELSKKFIGQQKYYIASGILEQILIFDSANSQAYFQRLLIELEIDTSNQLNESKVLLDDNENYNKALRNADNQFRLELLSYANKARENLYNNAISDVENRRYEDALSKFKTIKKYKDSETQIENLEKTINDIEIERRYIKAITYLEEGLLSNSFDLFESVKSYKDTSEYLEKIKDLRNAEEKYLSGIIKDAFPRKEEVESSIQTLQSIGNYKDAILLVSEYQNLLHEIIEKETVLAKKKIKIKKVIKIGIWTGVPVLMLLIAFLIINATIIVPIRNYNYAMELINSGDYTEAKEILNNIKNYKDSNSQIVIIDAHIAFENEDFEEGISLLEEIGIPVDIDYNLDGGFSNELSFSPLVLLSISNDSPIKEGYAFNGWQLFDYTITNIPGEYEAEVFLKATYLISQYTITFELNGGYGVNDSSYNINSSTILLQVPIREGYTFGGWYNNSLFTDSSVTSISTGTTGDKEFYAKWTPQTFVISFSPNGGALSETTRSVIFETSIELPTPSKSNYIFDGWYYNDELVESGIWLLPSNANLTAQWINRYLTVTYDTNGGVISHSSQEVEYGQVYELLIPVKENYIFMGWKNSGIDFNIEGVWNEKQSITLVAEWDSLFTYTIDNNEITITGFKHIYSGTQLTFPAELNGKTVTKIGNNGSIGLPSQITHLTVPNSVITISAGAFSNANNLVYISIPFVGASRTATGSGLNTSEIRFGYIFGVSNENVSSKLTTVIITDAIAIRDIAFSSTKITSIRISSGVTTIGYGAFRYATNLTSVTFESGSQLATISSYAFDGATKLARILLPNSLTYIGDSSFSNTAITTIIIPSGVSYIGSYAFATINPATIRVRVSSKPANWVGDWHYRFSGSNTVVWGYIGD